MKINVVKSPENKPRQYNAYISDHPELQGFGETLKEALGDLVVICPEIFNATIVRLGRNPHGQDGF